MTKLTKDLEDQVVTLRKADIPLSEILEMTGLGTHQIYWIYGKHGIPIEPVKKHRKIGNDGRGRPKIGVHLNKFLDDMNIPGDEIYGYEYTVRGEPCKLILHFIKKDD